MAGFVSTPQHAPMNRGRWAGNALKAPALEWPSAKTSRRFLDAGQILFIEHDRAQNLFIVHRGCIKIYKMLPDGRRQIIGFAFAHDLLGVPVRDGRFAFTAEAVSSACVSPVPIERLEGLAANSPRFTLQLVELMFNELAFAHDQLLLLGRKSAMVGRHMRRCPSRRSGAPLVI